MKPKNPIQPLIEQDGVLRFQSNRLVRALLDQPNGLNLNALAAMFPGAEHADDWRQLAQLIGYSLSGFGTLSYADDATCDTAAAMQEHGMTEDKARIATLEAQLADIRAGLREPVARLFGKHPDDLMETP